MCSSLAQGQKVLGTRGHGLTLKRKSLESPQVHLGCVRLKRLEPSASLSSVSSPGGPHEKLPSPFPLFTGLPLSTPAAARRRRTYTSPKLPQPSRGVPTSASASSPSLPASSADPVPPLVLLSVLVACLGAFSFGYHIAVVNGSLPFLLADIGHTGSALVGGWIVSVSLATAAAGAILGGLLADSLGRRGTLLYDAIPFVVGSALSAMATSVPQMLMGRALVGVAFGVASAVVPLYISEVSPPQVRGTFGSYNQLTICLGILGALVAGLPLSSSASWWRIMFWIGAIPPALSGLGFLLVAPETPAWLNKKGRRTEAARVEALLAGKSTDELSPPVSPRSSNSDGGALREAVDEALGEQSVSIAGLFGPKYRKLVTIGMLMFALQQFAGINAVVYYSSSVFQKVGITSDILASALVSVANVVGTLASSQLVDTQGRKKLLLASFAGMGVSMLLLAVALTVPAIQSSAGVLSVVGTVAYVLAFAFGVGPVPALLLPEIFPSTIRANAIAVSLMTHWVANFFIGLGFLQVVEAVGVAGAYLGFALVCFSGIAFTYFVLPETKGKSFEEIEAFFGGKEE